MHIRQILAANVAVVRRARGLSQEALAWEAGINRSYMGKIETANTWAGLEIICKLAVVLGVQPYELPMPPLKRGKRKA